MVIHHTTGNTKIRFYHLLYYIYIFKNQIKNVDQSEKDDHLIKNMSLILFLNNSLKQIFLPINKNNNIYTAISLVEQVTTALRVI